jgi:hypothetical protein
MPEEVLWSGYYAFRSTGQKVEQHVPCRLSEQVRAEQAIPPAPILVSISGEPAQLLAVRGWIAVVLLPVGHGVVQ